jgi:hypothetical protein
MRYDKVDRHGKVTLRYDSRLHHIGLGARHRGKPIVLFVADRDIRTTVGCVVVMVVPKSISLEGRHRWPARIEQVPIGDTCLRTPERLRTAVSVS